MGQIFISHIEEEQDIAEALARGLEREGYSTWYYERDAHPHPNRFQQVVNAIEKCSVMLVLLSPRSVKSEEVEEEVNWARQKHKRFVPIMYEMSWGDFERHPPLWHAALGTPASVAIPRGDVAEILPRLLTGIENFGLVPESRDSQEEPDLSGPTQEYERLAQSEQYDDAWDYFQRFLNYQLDFEQSNHWEHRRLLRYVFPDGFERDPALTNPSDKAEALNALARSDKNIGSPIKAVEVYRRQLALEARSSPTYVLALANLANALRLIGKLNDAETTARKVLDESTRLKETKWEAYGLYWNGVLRAGRGDVEDGILNLRRAQVLFDSVGHAEIREGAAGLSRSYSHLAQIELWLGNPEGALALATHAKRLFEQHGQKREKIFATRLLATSKMLQNKFEIARHELERVCNEAVACRYFEEEMAACIALAELHRRESISRNAKVNPSISRVWLSQKRLDQAREGGYSLLLSDAYNTLCQIYRDCGKQDDAANEASRAYLHALCDGPPFCYHWGLDKARRHLLDLGAQVPTGDTTAVGLPQPIDKSTIQNVLSLTEQEIAEHRAKFTMLWRQVNGHYRYAPTKFVRMLEQDWGAIRDIATGKAVQVAPQFVEIHLGQPCNLNCAYCRGELRTTPSKASPPVKELFLSSECVLRIVRSIQRLNRDAFVRFSGTIGEPLLHPRIRAILHSVSEVGISWGITTNGIRLNDAELRAELQKSKQVHVSIDAGTDVTYRRLKGGTQGEFERVLENVKLLVAEGDKKGQGPKVIVSFLLQDTNYKELAQFASMVKAIRANSLEIKMQHFDKNRQMSEAAVTSAYSLIDEIRRDLSDDCFDIVVVQSLHEALYKVRDHVERITFEKCYANQLGLSATVDPTGELQMCCQYYQKTLGSVGNLNPADDPSADDFEQTWNGTRRQAALKANPRAVCVNCSPSDEFINRFVQFLRTATEVDSDFLTWVEREVLIGRNRKIN